MLFKSHVEYHALYLVYIPTCLDAFDYISLMFVHASNFTCVNGQFFFLFEVPVGIGEHDSLDHQNSSMLGRLMSKNSASNTGTHAGLKSAEL